MAKKSLLIGASGRIGRMVVRAWRSSNHEWSQDPAQYRFDQQSECQTDLVWDISKGLDPVGRWMELNGAITTFIILAGTTPATGSEMSDNVAIANAYLTAARSLGVPRVLLASSSAVYGAGEGNALAENHPCRPLNAYGASKVEMELLAQYFRDEGTELCCLRIGNVAGADALLLRAPQANDRAPLKIDCFPDGHGPQRSYIGPSSLGSILGQLAYHDAELPFLLNVAAPSPVYMEELAEAADLPWTSRKPPPHVPQRIVLNCERLAKLVSLETGIGSASTLISEWKRCG